MAKKKEPKKTEPQKTEPNNEFNVLKQFQDLKEKHPDAMLLFRIDDFYEAYKEDAVKAASILSITLTNRKMPGEEQTVKYTAFPYQALDAYLPKLIRAGARVAICDQLVDPKQKKVEKETAVKEEIHLNQRDMTKKKNEQATQEVPEPAVKNTAEEKPAKSKKTGETASSTTSQEIGEQLERKPREPQMITANGEKVTHGHAYQSKVNPEDWYFTAKIDGQQLKPQLMDAADLAAYQKKEVTVPQLMERYYPTKLMPKVAEDAYKMPLSMEGPEGNITVEKFNVYKEKDEQRADFGQYKFFVQVGETRMSALASRQDLDAYFDRVVTPEKLVERNFGERLHLKSAYEKYQLPEGVDKSGVRVAKDRNDHKWKVSVDMGEKGRTSKQEISFDDGYSLFKAKTATREQIAAKYLNTEITGLLAGNTAKVEKSASLKL